MKLRSKLFRDVLNGYLSCRGKVPFNAVLVLSNRCNFKCSYCNIYEDKLNEMTTSKYYEVIDDLTKYGTIKISLLGGEPLLRQDISKIINYAKEKGLMVGLASNGFLVKKRINDIKNLDYLHLSFDGPEKIHDEQRQKGSYNKLIEGIKVASRYNNINITTTTVLTKYNLNCVDFIVKKAKELNFTCFFQPVSLRSFCSNSYEMVPDKNEFKKTIKKIMDLKKGNNHIGNSIDALNYYYYWPDKKLKCSAGTYFINIDPNGDVYSCLVRKEKDMDKPLNYLTDGLKNAIINTSKIVDCKFKCPYSYLEFNLLFSFKPNSIKNALNILNNQ